jgi:riboflavin kinase/FMN adenylyltransferase
MKLIRGLYNIRPEHKGSVVTIGNFDGIHRGHQAVIKQVREQARKLDTTTTVFTFDPLPQEYFLGDKAPARLTTLREKYLQFQRLRIDQMLSLPFNAKLAAMPAQQFIDDILVDGLAIQAVVVGDDFRFGKGRSGDFAMLAAAGQQHGFDVIDTHTLVDHGERISSTRIRNALADGDLELAGCLLGRPYSMSGTVIHGEKLGRTIGFPTANIRIHRTVSPLRGVFAVEVEGIGYGVTNVGTRPTVDGKGFLVETHLLDFSGDLYGQHINIRWLKKLRGEQKFDSLDALKLQIGKDIEAARDYFVQLETATR